MPFNASYWRTYREENAVIDDTDTTVPKQIAAAAVQYGMSVSRVRITSQATGPAVVDFVIDDGITDCVIASVNVPAGAGYGGVAAVDAMLALTGNANGELLINYDGKLKANVEATLPQGESLGISTVHGDF